jgi:hypothetical protein
MSEYVDRLEVVYRPILEFEPQEITGVRRQPAAQFNGECTGIIRYTVQYGSTALRPKK